MNDKRTPTGADLLGGLAVLLLVVFGVLGLVGVLIIDEGSETFGKMLGVALGILLILAAARFAFQGWQAITGFLGSLPAEQPAPPPTPRLPGE